jgi:hypothetical protein
MPPDSRDKKALALMVGTSHLPLLFSSIETAESYLEGMDIESGEYTYAMSPDGVQYKLLSDGRNGAVIILDADAERRTDVAHNILAEFLQTKGRSVDPDAALDTLVDLCQDFIDDGV